MNRQTPNFVCIIFGIPFIRFDIIGNSILRRLSAILDSKWPPMTEFQEKGELVCIFMPLNCTSMSFMYHLTLLSNYSFTYIDYGKISLK